MAPAFQPIQSASQRPNLSVEPSDRSSTCNGENLMRTESAKRRLYPRITDTDWLGLRELRSAIEDFAALTAGQGKAAIDFGCGSQPYRSIFESKGTIYRGADFSD